MVARWQARPGRADEVAGVLARLRAATLAEPGCVDYTVGRSDEDDHSFVVVERFRDRDAFDAHTETAHFRELVLETARPLLAEDSTEFWTEDP